MAGSDSCRRRGLGGLGLLRLAVGFLDLRRRLATALARFPGRFRVVCRGHQGISVISNLEPKRQGLRHVCAEIAFPACSSRGTEVLIFGTPAERLEPCKCNKRTESSSDHGAKENRMRAFIGLVLGITASAAAADEIDDAHRQAVAGRDSYWNCLAQEYSRDRHNGVSGQEFGALLAGACPSERQNFRVTLVNYLAMQFPSEEAGAHVTTANNAIALAQKDIVAAFVKPTAASK
jgi:hypothetical protein